MPVFPNGEEHSILPDSASFLPLFGLLPLFLKTAMKQFDYITIIIPPTYLFQALFPSCSCLDVVRFEAVCDLSPQSPALILFLL